MDRYAAQAALLKALSHPVRLQIAEILAEDEACVCHLQAVLGLRQAYISQQIMVLRKAGLLEERREGTFIFYRMREPRALQVLRSARRTAGVDDLLRLPQRLADCGCPRCAGTAEASAH